MSRQLRGRGYLSAAVMALSVLIVVATVWPQQPVPQPARRNVAVYQFNSGLPDVPGPVVREMFVAALVQTGRFTVMQPNQPGTELVMDAVINEANLAQVKAKPELNDLLKGLLTGDVRPLSFDVRVMDARNGAILDIVQITGKDMKNTKVNLADFGSVLGSDKAKRDALNQRLMPYLNEAIARIVARHAPMPLAQMQPGMPMQPGGFSQPGFPPTTAPAIDPYQQQYGQTSGQTGYPQSSYPSTTSPYGTPQPGYPSTQQPYGQTGTQAYGQPSTQPYGQPGYPQGTAPQGTSPYPSTTQPGTPAYGQPGYPAPGTPQDPYAAQQPYGQTGTQAYGQPGTQPYGQPGAPSTGYPATGTPQDPYAAQQPYGQAGTQAYGQPGYPAPGTPQDPYAAQQPYGQTGTQAYGQPGTQPYGQPGAPSTGYPATGTSQDPYAAQQQYGQTGTQAYGQPGTQPYGQPGYPAPGTPQDPYAAQQPYGQAGTQAYGQPGTQPYGQPGYPAGTQGTAGYPPGTAAPYYGQAQPGQMQVRGIGGEGTMTIEVTPERLLLGFDPTQHEVADVREKARAVPKDGDALIHTAPSGHKLYANVKKGEVQSWSAKDDKDKEIPLYLLNDEPNCWECAMNPSLCWKVMCPLESELGQPDSKK